jgi:phosphate transport system substrate-binding protein
MRVSFWKLGLAVCMAGALTASQGAAAETWRIAGTGGAIPMAQRVATEFAAATGIELEVVPGLGSKGSIRAAVDGVVAFAISALPLTAEEAALGLSATPIARTALVFITSHPNPNSVKSSELTAIFKSGNPKWADGSPMNLILRTRLDSDSVILMKLFPGMAEAFEAARKRPELPIAPTDQDNAELAERLKGSFVQSGLSQIVTEKRNLRFVPLDGVEPTLANLDSGKYPYEKHFYLVYSAKTKDAADRLIEFLRSEKGHSILRETGCLPAGI